jgi:hypothetical protein
VKRESRRKKTKMWMAESHVSRFVFICRLFLALVKAIHA